MCLMVVAAVAQEKKGGPQAQSVPAQQSAAAAQAQPTAAQPVPAPAQSQKAAKTKKVKLQGTVQAVDSTNKKVSVKMAKTEEVKEISITDEVKLSKGGNHKEITLANLKVGARVAVTMEGDVVRSIHMYLTSK
jgi:hypothetical protein